MRGQYVGSSFRCLVGDNVSDAASMPRSTHAACHPHGSTFRLVSFVSSVAAARWLWLSAYLDVEPVWVPLRSAECDHAVLFSWYPNAQALAVSRYEVFGRWIWDRSRQRSTMYGVAVPRNRGGARYAPSWLGSDGTSSPRSQRSWNCRSKCLSGTGAILERGCQAICGHGLFPLVL